MWTEKYRPKTLDNMINQKDIVERLKSFATSKNVPHSIFAGPPGTGKTMAAEIIANELELNMYRVDLSMVVSKYVGETEKNLNRIFKDAEDSNAILFFDEADALFGKRSEVKDSHDRYANAEINYLLQKIEEHEGIVVLATNLRKNIDSSFVRRMHFVVDFPFPNKKCRFEIWKKVFPENTPMDDVDFDFLSKLKISGGDIKQFALKAAFLAVQNSDEIKIEHIVNSIKIKFQKNRKSLLPKEFQRDFKRKKAKSKRRYHS